MLSIPYSQATHARSTALEEAAEECWLSS
jgi:hypothetical protein